MPTTSTCQHCGNSFIAQRSDRKYCSLQCATDASKRRTVVTCPCGHVFESRVGRKQAKYCSQECRYKYQPYPERGGKVKRVCLACGREFMRRKDAPGRFCSKKCHDEGKRVPRVECTCEQCGKPYSVIPFFATKRNTRYCSRDCMNAAMSLRKQGAGNVNYRGGSVPYRGGNWRRQGRLARERDGYRCQICGVKIGKRKHDYGVHHITPYRDFNGDWKRANDLSNLITLCVSCHSRVEFGELPCPRPLI